MNSTSPKSKRRREQEAHAKEKEQKKKRTIMYAGIAVAAVVVIIIAAWFLMQPGPVTMDSMKKSLKDAHYETTDLTSSELPAAGAVGGFSFVVDDDHHLDNCTIYQFESAEKASAYAAGKVSAIANGVWVLEIEHTSHAPSNFIKNLFNDLVNGKKLGHNPGHSHGH